MSFYPYRFARSRCASLDPTRRGPSGSTRMRLDGNTSTLYTSLRRGRIIGPSITPYGSPTLIYFAKPSVDALNTPPNAYATSNDFWTPTLQGPTEIIVGYEYFQQTPGMLQTEWIIWRSMRSTLRSRRRLMGKEHRRGAWSAIWAAKPILQDKRRRQKVLEKRV